MGGLAVRRENGVCKSHYRWRRHFRCQIDHLCPLATFNLKCGHGQDKTTHPWNLSTVGSGRSNSKAEEHQRSRYRFRARKFEANKHMIGVGTFGVVLASCPYIYADRTIYPILPIEEERTSLELVNYPFYF